MALNQRRVSDETGDSLPPVVLQPGNRISRASAMASMEQTVFFIRFFLPDSSLMHSGRIEVAALILPQNGT